MVLSPDGSDIPWPLPLASHTPVTRDARRDRESAWTLAEVFRPLTCCNLVSHDFRGHRVVRPGLLQVFRRLARLPADERHEGGMHPLEPLPAAAHCHRLERLRLLERPGVPAVGCSA